MSSTSFTRHPGTYGKGRALFIVFSVVALVLSACGGDTDDEVPEPNTNAAADGSATEAEDESEEECAEYDSVTYATTSTAVNVGVDTPIVAVPEALGFFEEECLEVEYQHADGSTGAIQALGTGSADFILAGAESVIAATEEGVPVKMFYPATLRFPYSFAVEQDSDIHEIADLEGRTIGVISLASASYPFATTALEEGAGLTENDVEIAPVSVGPAAAAALTGGQVDALAHYNILYANFLHEGLELRFLENPEFFNDLFSTTWTTRTEIIEDDPELAERFMRAVQKGTVFSIANVDAALEMGYEYFPEVLEGSTPEEARGGHIAAMKAWFDLLVPVGPEVEEPSESPPEEWGAWGEIAPARWESIKEFARIAGTLDGDPDTAGFWDGSLTDQITDSVDIDAMLTLAEEWE